MSHDTKIDAAHIMNSNDNNKVDTKTLKRKIRRECNALRSRMTQEQLYKLNCSIVDKLFNLDEYKLSDTIFTYLSAGNEVDTYRIVRDSWNRGKRIAIPYTVPDSNEMLFVGIESFEGLKLNPFGFHEPSDASNMINCDENTLIIVPGAAFDKKLNRLGHGRGYYDRYIAENEHGSLIAVAYEFQVLDSVPVDVWDKKVDMIVTDVRVYV